MAFWFAAKKKHPEFQSKKVFKVIQPRDSTHAIMADVAKIIKAIKGNGSHESFYFALAWHPSEDGKKDEFYNSFYNRVFEELRITSGLKIYEVTNPINGKKWERVSYTIKTNGNRTIEHLFNARFFLVKLKKARI